MLNSVFSAIAFFTRLPASLRLTLIPCAADGAHSRPSRSRPGRSSGDQLPEGLPLRCTLPAAAPQRHAPDCSSWPGSHRPFRCSFSCFLPVKYCFTDSHTMRRPRRFRCAQLSCPLVFLLLCHGGFCRSKYAKNSFRTGGISSSRMFCQYGGLSPLFLGGLQELSSSVKSVDFICRCLE